VKITRLSSLDSDFYSKLDEKLAWESVSDRQTEDRVRAIIERVRSEGDDALVAMTQEFDQRPDVTMADLIISAEQLEAALQRISPEHRKALEIAAERISSFHQHQKQESWSYREADGTLLGQQITPLQRVGVYVPGGKASYPSSVLMNVIPARVAGVEQVVMVSPSPRGELNDLVLAAAAIAGVDACYSIGGAQAVAALAYGTQTIARVNKIVGPGNTYVATAKKQVFGVVGIDMIAGPSEILVIADGSTPAEWVAMDLFSQAEHDEQAQSILISPDADYLDEVEQAMLRLVNGLSRAAIIRQSMEGRGMLIKTSSLEEAMDVANYVAPEHLELSLSDPERWLSSIRHAGAIFLGPYTSEALGDYCAGPNHVLPTSGTARFSSPLGVYDFQTRSSLIGCSAEKAHELGKITSVLARGEQLEAHALSAEYRLRNP